MHNFDSFHFFSSSFLVFCSYIYAYTWNFIISIYPYAQWNLLCVTYLFNIIFYIFILLYAIYLEYILILRPLNLSIILITSDQTESNMWKKKMLFLAESMIFFSNIPKNWYKFHVCSIENIKYKKKRNNNKKDIKTYKNV